MTNPTHHIPFFDLRTPADLFRKAECDLAALEKAPTDSYLAFNLFVTLEHLPDWLGKRELVHPQDETKRNSILKIVSHLANGAKHFYVQDRRHKSVQNLIEKGWDDGWATGWAGRELNIELTMKEREALQCKGEAIAAITLARRTIDFWRPYIIASATP